MKVVAELRVLDGGLYDVFIGSNCIGSSFALDGSDIIKVDDVEDNKKKVKQLLKLKESGFTAEEIIEMKDKELL